MLKHVLAVLAVASPLLSLNCPSALAAPSPKASQYFAAREKARLVNGLTPQQLQLRGKQYLNNVIEVKGAIMGSARRDNGGTVVIRSSVSDLEYVVEVGPEIPESQLEIGQNVRVLARVAPVTGSEQPQLQVTAMVTEGEALQAEAEWARLAAERRAAEEERARRSLRLASRGTHQAAAGRQAAARPGGFANQREILDQYKMAVLYFNSRLYSLQAERIAASIINYSNRYGLDARLVMAVIACESNFNVNAVSRAGAMGLGQLMPGTAGGLGVGDAFDPEQNLEGSTRLWSGHIATMARKNGQLTMREIQLALACYNAGAGAVKKYKGIPPYRETRNYVAKITRLYNQLCGAQ